MLPVAASVPVSTSGLDAVLAERVRSLRERRGWRPLDLAVAAGWSRATVVDVEAGRRRLTVRDVAVLCGVFRVPLAALVEGADEAGVLGLTPTGEQ